MYIAAVVLTNLLTAKFGPWVSVINAFAFIGLDLTSRDGLHDLWEGRRLALKMGLLIAAGSLISWLLNGNAERVALASCLSFFAAATADTLTYSFLRGKPHFTRVNGSNLVSSAVDSTIFPLVAFGLPMLWPVVAGQFVAKTLGGFVWSLILRSNVDPD